MKVFKNCGSLLATLASNAISKVLAAGERVLVQGGSIPQMMEVHQLSRNGSWRVRSSAYRGPGFGTGFARCRALDRKYIIKGCRP